jgi:hypothetical protein
MRNENYIILIIFFFILSGCAPMPEGSNRMNTIKIGMTRSEVFSNLGMNSYPSANTRFNDDNTIESWQLRRAWFNNHYTDASGHKISNRGVYNLTFRNGTLVNINKK